MTSSSKASFVIATRKSKLALWQANHIKQQIELVHPKVRVELLPLSTKGDRILDSPLAKVGGKGLFVKELEVAIMEGRAHMAVHSMKDVPMALPEPLEIRVICERANPYDAFVSNHFPSIDALPQGACVGTSSFRRQSQLKRYRPDLVIADLRGNIHTRIEKLQQGRYDAIILAAAGLERMALGHLIGSAIGPEISLPAVGQGALGIECKADDEATLEIIQHLSHSESTQVVTAERALNQALNGGCQVPIAGFAQIKGSVGDSECGDSSVSSTELLSLHARVLSLDGQALFEVMDETPLPASGDKLLACTALGERVAKQLLEQGAGAVLSALAQPTMA